MAHVRGVRAGLIVAVSDELFGEQWHLGFDHSAHTEALLRAADVVMGAAGSLS